MKRKNLWLGLGLTVLLIAAAGLGLLLDPGVQSSIQPPREDYQLLLTEVCAKNETVIADNSGRYRDYIELYNLGQDVDLSGCVLTDGTTRSQPMESFLLPAGGYRILFLGDEVTGFGLSSSGRDTIQLLDPAGNILVQAKVQSMGKDQAMVWQDERWLISDTPTPGFSNDASGRKAFRQGAALDTAQLRISEVLIANESALPDENGIFTDVIELHNTGDTSLWLSSYCLSDRQEDRFRYRLPEWEMPAGAYITVFCDAEGYISEDGLIHAGFALSAGESVFLTDAAGNYLQVETAYVGQDTSQALTQSGWQEQSASLGYPNTEEGIYQAQRQRIREDSPLQISEVLLSGSGIPWEGSFCDVVELWNASDEPVNTAGWYLSDGGDPYRYALPEQTLQPGEYLLIPCTPATTGFSLSEGEWLYLTGPDYRCCEPVQCLEGPENTTVSLSLQAGDAAYSFLPITLGMDNREDSHERLLAQQLSQGLRISEVMTSNDSYLRGAYGTTTDWVELYNASQEEIRLSEYALSDASGDLGKYPLPDKVLKPGGYICLMLSETGKNIRSGYSWLPFGLSAAGDRLYLSKDGIVVDHVFLPELETDVAYGRAPQQAGFTQLAKPTPDKANAETARISRTPEPSLAQGSYDDVQSITVSLSATGEIYYTTDCTTPSKRTKKYTGPITLTETTVLRCIAYEEDATASAIVNLTYLINENDSLSALSLVTHPSNLWDYETGIYVMGGGASEVSPYKGANFWMNWEKQATATLFETDGSIGFSEGCGLKIFGGFSRANSKKSFACMFRNRYGASSLDYPLFGDGGIGSFESFVLRAGGQDTHNSKIRDELITSLASDYLGLPVQRFRPVALYLNGEYWGIYFIREKLTDQYVAGNFHVKPEEVTLSNWTGGDCPEYLAVRDYARSHDLSQQKYFDQLATMINVQNYMDYTIAQIWVANTDLGNVKFFKTTEHPWHWALFDTDLSFWKVSHNSVSENLTKKSMYSMDPHSKIIIVRMLKNQQFRQEYIARMAWQINNVWTEENVVKRIDEIAAMLAPDMAKECDRWGGSVERWEKNLQTLRNFAANRTDYVLQHIQAFFGLTDQQMRQYGFEV